MIMKRIQTIKKLIQKKARSVLSDDNTDQFPDFGDPIATSIDWTPVNKDLSDGTTYNVVERSQNRLEFRPSLVSRILGSLMFLFMAVGIIGIVIILFIVFINWAATTIGIFSIDLSLYSGLVPALLGSIILALLPVLVYNSNIPIVFDKRLGACWEGRKLAEAIWSVELKEIHALQLLSKHVSTAESSSWCYELNFVLADGTRLLVLDYGYKRKLRKYAGTISVFLNKPVWDGISWTRSHRR
jgi:hypothetical protein